MSKEKLDKELFYKMYRNDVPFSEMARRLKRTVACLRAIIRKEKTAERYHYMTPKEERAVERMIRNNLNDRDIEAAMRPKGPSRSTVMRFRAEKALPEYVPNKGVRAFLSERKKAGDNYEAAIAAAIRQFGVERRFVRRVISKMRTSFPGKPKKKAAS